MWIFSSKEMRELINSELSRGNNISPLRFRILQQMDMRPSDIIHVD